MATIQKNKISSCLWFDNQAEQAARYYTSIFKNSKIGRIARYGKEGFEIHKKPAGSVLTVEFWLEDQEFLALNGGQISNSTSQFPLSSTAIRRKKSTYWKSFEGGDKNSQQCGWLKDKFGLSWQVVPGAF
jgi:predicted 3-demethylubiquinone-9 3-methyltransferase (glyoxalase superfamily)